MGFLSQNQNQRVEVSLLNAFWLDNKFTLQESFKKQLKDVFEAEAKEADFKNKADEVVKEANSWAKSATRGSIQDILKPEDINSDDTILVLANALYFKGVWPIEEKFNKENTKEGKFFLLNGDEVLVPFMSKRINHASTSYGTFDGFDVLKLKYANREFSMYFFLPNKKDGLQDLLNEFKTSPKSLDSNLYALLKLLKSGFPNSSLSIQ